MDNKQNITQEKSVFHSFTGGKPFFTPLLLVVFLVVIGLGAGAGYFLVTMQSGKMSTSTSATTLNGKSVVKGAVYGTDDTTTFKDTAEGVMTAGGIDGEGQFHLVRPGGDSQNVYMTSSLVDLSIFLGKKVKVWGATQTAQKAGWLMDVGRVEVLE